jgi:CRISPR-associated protein Csh1
LGLPQTPTDKEYRVFQRLHEFSRILSAKADWERLNEGMPPNYDRGIAICFDNKGHWRLQDRQGSDGVLYRSGPPNGVDYTPCNKLANNTAKRFLNGAEKFYERGHIEADKKAWLRSAIASYKGNSESIWTALEAKKQEAGIDGKDHRGYVYLARNDLADPVYAWPETKEYLVAQFLEAFEKGGVRNGNCAVCGAAGKTFYGNYSVIACYNLDKRGSIAGGFAAGEAHRNLPVCANCALALAEAFAYAERHFTSFMAGQTYMVFPYAESEEIQQQLAYRLGQDPKRFDLGRAHDLVAQELAIHREFTEYKDQLAFALIFFTADQASWRVRAEIQQLLPSRMKGLLNAAREIADAPDLQTITKEEVKPVHISAMTLNLFAGHGDTQSADILRDWLVALFEERAVDARHFIHHLVAKLTATGKSNPGQLGWMTRQAWGLYRYASLSGLIRLQPQTIEETTMQDAVPNSPYGKYIEEHQGFFRHPEQIVAFLTGCYVSRVCAAQRDARGADPFKKKFMGRILNKPALKNLYREGHGKLAQYDKLGYVITGLDPDLASAWVDCGDDWTISEDDATFTFTIGYSLAYRINQLYGQNQTKETDQ